jgi:hypothetical protein
MNFFIIARRLLIILLLGNFGHALAGDTDKTQSEGTLSFYFSDGTPQCSFPANPGTQLFVEKPNSSGNYPCKLLKTGGYFELRDVPSTTRIWLVTGRPKQGQIASSPKKCGLSDFDAFSWYELLVIKNPTTTANKINTLDLNTLPPGNVIAPGLRFINRPVFQTPVNPNEINCVIIQR